MSVYAFLGSLAAFALGLDIMATRVFWPVALLGVLVFWLLVSWGAGVLARNQKAANQ